MLNSQLCCWFWPVQAIVIDLRSSDVSFKTPELRDSDVIMIRDRDSVRELRGDSHCVIQEWVSDQLDGGGAHGQGGAALARGAGGDTAVITSLNKAADLKRIFLVIYFLCHLFFCVTSEQFLFSHWAWLGQHSPTGMGASSPELQSTGAQVTWSQLRSPGQRPGSGQQEPGRAGARSPLGQRRGWHSVSRHAASRLSKQKNASGQHWPGGTGATDPSSHLSSLHL